MIIILLYIYYIIHIQEEEEKICSSYSYAPTCNDVFQKNLNSSCLSFKWVGNDKIIRSCEKNKSKWETSSYRQRDRRV